MADSPKTQDGTSPGCLAAMVAVVVVVFAIGGYIAYLAIGIAGYGADLTGANLSYSNVWNADFTGANLTDARFTESAVTGAVWSNTVCPDGTNSDDHGATCTGHGVSV